jgi:hypothetical protein
MAYQIVDFSDIYSMVLEELKIQPSDTTTLNRIKRDINAIYLNEVVPFKRWKWLSGHTDVEFKPYYGAGTASVTPDSTTVTLSTIVPLASGSKAGYYFATDSFDEIYKIEAHTAGSDTITLTTPYTGTVNTAVKFKIWTDQIALPADCRETVEVWHDYHRKNMDPVGLQEFRRLVKEGTRNEGRPEIYSTYDYYDPTSGTGETESDRYRLMLIYPSIYQNSTTVHIDYTKEASALNLDGDEPIMPLEDRIVLVYGALSRAWVRERNPEESQRNYQLYQNKLGQMAGKLEDSFDTPSLSPSNKYISRMRGNRIKGQSRRLLSSTAGGGSSYSSPTYLKNVTIEGAQVTDDITVDTGVTIDGRDLSADGSSLDSHVAATTNVHGTGTGNAVVGTGTTQTLTNKTIDADLNTISNIEDADIKSGAAIAYSKLNLTGSLTDADIAALAAIAYSKLALTNSIVNADVAAGAAVAYAKLNLAASLVNADVAPAAAIAYSKLALTGSIVNADVSAGAAIDYSKLALTGTIVNGDIANAAAIARSKIATGTAYGAVVNDSSGALTSVAPGTANNVLISDGTAWTSGTIAAPNLSVTTKTANYTLTSSDDLVLADASGGAFTLTLPSAASNTGKQLRIKKIDSSVNAVSISGNVDGIARRLGAKNDEIVITSDGTNWYLIAGGETVSFRYHIAAGSSVSTANALINYNTKDHDHTADYSGGQFTCTNPGLYAFKGSLYLFGAFTLYGIKNGSTYEQGTIASASTPSCVSGQVRLAIGDTFELWSDQTGTTGGNAELNHFEMTRIGN